MNSVEDDGTIQDPIDNVSEAGASKVVSRLTTQED
jgi:hypothetical protein